MRYALTLGASSSLEAGRQVARNLPSHSLESDRALYAVLVALAFDTVEEKQYPVVPQFVTFHSSLTCIAAVLGVSRWTVWRSLARLKNLGLVDARVQKGRLFDKVRNTGTVIQVKLVPGAGSNAKLSYQDIHHAYKDMTRLARCKRLSHQLMHHIQALKDQLAKYLLLKEWTLTPYSDKSPIQSMLHAGLEALLDVNSAPREKVNQAVDSAACALASALRDSKGVNYYRKLLWQVLRHSRASQTDYSYQVYLTAQRARTDALEGFARKPGALFTSRVAKFDWYQSVMEGPPIRVGVSP